MADFDTIQDLRDRLAAAKRTLEDTRKRVEQETKEQKERLMIEQELLAIQKETERIAWGGL